LPASSFTAAFPSADVDLQVTRPKQGRAQHNAALIAAYREGLGLAAIMVVRNPATGLRIAAAKTTGDVSVESDEFIEVRWWCRRTDDAQRIAALARRGRAVAGVSSGDARNAVTDAATRLGIVLFSDDDVAEEPTQIIARVDIEIADLQRAGGLKSVNQSYHVYRIEAAGRGKKVLPYSRWLNDYKANLVRQLANTLRFI